MAKEEIVEGLRVAINKGEPLKQAMMSFFNAGFDKKDVEEAAKALSARTLQQRSGLALQQQQVPIQQQTQPQIMPLPGQIQQQIPVQPIQQFRQLPQTFQPVQMVSDYGKKPGMTSLIITIILIFLLLSLLGILSAVVLFKEELTQFFNSAF